VLAVAESIKPKKGLESIINTALRLPEGRFEGARFASEAAKKDG
jgi:hypothetical protein